MTDTFTLGRNGKFGNIDFEKLRSGITKKDLGIEGDTVLSNIFDSIDNGGEDGGENKGNGKLERNEIVVFINKIKELAGNDKLSKREAKNYEVDGEKLGKNREELLVFISKLAELTKGVASVDKQTEIVTYEDGHTESTECCHYIWNCFIYIVKRLAIIFSMVSYYIFFLVHSF